MLSVDEESHIEQINRTQKALPMFPERLQSMTHDYKRIATMTLFGAMNAADGTVLADLIPQHRHRVWLDFLKIIDESFPGFTLQMLGDIYTTHEHERVRKWLARLPRFHIHFTSTSSSPLNLVQGWFRDLTEPCVRRGSFNSVVQPQPEIWKYTDRINNSPKPFIWTANSNDILAKDSRARAAPHKSQSE